LDPPADGFQKFLQALGYSSSFEFDPEKEERIQMHADKLYHRMLDYETRVEEARAAGLEPPPPRSLFNPEAKTISQSPASSPGGSDATMWIPGGEQLPPSMKPTKPLKDLTPHERELEVRALKQRMAQRQIYMREVANTLESEEEAKAKRREKLSGWFGPTIAKWLA
jgi:hypothetical protein